MTNDIAIRVEGLSKKYRIGNAQPRYQTFRDAFMRSIASPLRWLQAQKQEENTIWALDNISFEIKHGEAVGVIGRNGAGKSTLLKVLSRITKPTRGRVDLFGRVGSLLEVGTGFHPELSGRENIYLNGAILGMNRREIDRKFDEIVDFAEIEKFLDTPVKHYSSGMYVRLAFAVAAHLEPEVLVVDEVLAVGDAAFQKKCLGKMGTVSEEGRTVLFVSHNMSAIQALCRSAILLSHGSLISFGNTDQIVENYLTDVSIISRQALQDRKDRSGNGRLRFTNIVFEGDDGQKLDELISGQKTSILLSYEAAASLKNVVVSIGFYGNFGQFLLLCNNEMAGVHFEQLPATGQIKCSVPKLPFSQGIYHINLYCDVNGVQADWVQEAASVHVIDGDFYGTGRSVPSSHGGFLTEQVWSNLPGA